MAYEVKGKTISLKAQTAITKSDKFKPVTIVGDDTFALAVTGDAVIGVIQAECAVGEAGPIMISGVTFYKCTATVVAGQEIDTWGVALQGGSSGDIISVLIRTRYSAGTLGSLTVTSAAGTTTGTTAITVSPTLTTGNKYKYYVGAAAESVAYGDNLAAWTDWNGIADITAATNKVLTLVECNVNSKALSEGHATVTAKAE